MFDYHAILNTQNFINWSKMQGYEIVIGSDKMPIYQKNNEDFSPEEVVNEFNNNSNLELLYTKEAEYQIAFVSVSCFISDY